MKPKAYIISIGDELLYGQVLNSNAFWLAKELDRIGIRISGMITVGDNDDQIKDALTISEQRAEIIIVTGGLGPTEDDITRQCFASFFDCPLVLNNEALRNIEEIYTRIGRPLTVENRMQAYLPSCCEKITNRLGTAAGMLFKKDNKVFISLPGVPGEMKNMMVEEVMPLLQQQFETETICHKVIKTAGVGETVIADKIAPWLKNLPAHFRIAYLPNLGQVTLRVTANGDDREQLKAEVEDRCQTMYPLIEKFIYGYDNETLEGVVGRILTEQNKTIAIAESCTGGYISHMVTAVPGSSQYYKGSVVPYHNDLKDNILGVSKEILEKYGAVSEQTVIQMAKAVKNRMGADVGLASSGIAGPGGGSPDKPVGTIWIACANGEIVVSKKLQLFKDRLMNIETTGVAALNLVRLSLLQTVEINP